MPAIQPIEVKVDDLYQLPAQEQVGGNIQLTLGDLHANAIKLLYMMHRYGITTNLDETKFNKLVEIYKKETGNPFVSSTLEKDDLDTFRTIINELTFNKNALIRLIGDELGDRGQNDIFVLWILDRLKKSGVTVEILLSNHSLAFIENYMYDRNANKNSEGAALSSSGDGSGLLGGFLGGGLGGAASNQKFSQLQPRDMCSLSFLQRIVSQGLISMDELNLLISSYKTQLKLIAHERRSVEGSEAIYIFTHAPINLNVIERIAEVLQVPYDASSPVALENTINKINDVYQKEYVQKNKIPDLINYSEINRKDVDEVFTCPFAQLIWARLSNNEYFEREYYQDESGEEEVRLTRTFNPQPHLNNGSSVYYIHGHTPPLTTNPSPHHVFNTDNTLGKQLEPKGNCLVMIGEHVALTSSLSSSAASSIAPASAMFKSASADNSEQAKEKNLSQRKT